MKLEGATLTSGELVVELQPGETAELVGNVSRGGTIKVDMKKAAEAADSEETGA